MFARTLARLRPDGTIQFPTPLGTEFTPRGVPLHPTADLSPEFAVQQVFIATGLRAVDLPELDGCLVVWVACAQRLGLHWTVRVEHPLDLVTSAGVSVRTDRFVVQVGYGALAPGGVYVADPIQPGPTWQPFDRALDSGASVPDSVRLVVTRPVALVGFSLKP